MNNDDECIIGHQSGINQKGEPFVQLLRNKRVIGQLTPQEARDHAQAVLEAAEAAEQDAFMWAFTREHIGCDEAAAFGMLQEFRLWRKARTGKQGGPTDKRDWVRPDKPGKV